MNATYSLIQPRKNSLQLVLCTVIMALTCLIIIAWPSVGQACSCMMPDIDRQIETSSAIFTGRVIDADRLNAAPLSQPDLVRVVFSLERAYKGDLSGTATVYTAANAAACGVNFLVGERYLVFAYESEGTLRTGLCNMTQPVEGASDVLRQLSQRRTSPEVINQSMLSREMRAVDPMVRPGYQQDGDYLRSWRLRWGRIYSHARLRRNS